MFQADHFSKHAVLIVNLYSMEPYIFEKVFKSFQGGVNDVCCWGSILIGGGIMGGGIIGCSYSL